MLPSFNISGDILIKMYHQIDDENNFKYRPKIAKVTGEPNPFKQLSRNDLISDTKIMSQAYNFDFERLNYNRMLLALKQILDAEPIFRSNPNAVYEMLRTVVKTWHPLVARKVNQFLPDPEEFQQQLNTTAIKAVESYIKMTNEQAQITGQPPTYDKEQLVAVVGQMLAQMVNPEPEKKAS